MRAFAGMIDTMVRRGPRPGSLEAYGVALACVLAATLLRLLINIVSPDAVPFATFFPALLIATLAGGPAAGVLATVLGAVVSWWLFIEPRFAWMLASKDQFVSVLLYLFAGGLIVWTANQYRVVIARIDEEEKYRRIVVDELSHRVKNKLATIYAILRHELRDQPDIWDSVSGRLQALATTDDLLSRGENGGVSLQQILTMEIAPFGDGRVVIDGPDVDLFGKMPTVVALVFHELMTNAVKYGALSDSGSVEVVWRIDEDGSLLIDWNESGGPAVLPPTRRGFGTVVIEQTIPHDLGGDAQLNYQLGGLSAHFCIPSRHVAGIGVLAARGLQLGQRTFDLRHEAAGDRGRAAAEAAHRGVARGFQLGVAARRGARQHEFGVLQELRKLLAHFGAHIHQQAFQRMARAPRQRGVGQRA